MKGYAKTYVKTCARALCSCLTIVLLMLLALACSPKLEQPEQAPEQVKPQPSEPAISVEEAIEEEKTASRVEEEEVGPGPTGPAKIEIEPYSQLGCEQLASAEEFAAACGIEKITRTAKIGTKNCYLSFTSPEFERRTAGIVLTAYSTGQEALKELERRAGMRKAEVSKTVGQGIYKFAELGRTNLEFVQDRYIVAVSADNQLCQEKGLLELAKIIAGKLD